MSSNCSPTGDTRVRRKEKDGSINHIPCPPSIIAYNKYMAGVDKADQMRGYYKVRSKSRKYYKYIFWFLFDCCVVNTFVLMKNFRLASDNTPNDGLKAFRMRLADRLIGGYNSRQRYTLPPAIHEVSINKSTPPPIATKHHRQDSTVEAHFPIKGGHSRCAYCWNYKDHRHHESSIHCRGCGKAFCVVSHDPPGNGHSCFERYHVECI